MWEHLCIISKQTVFCTCVDLFSAEIEEFQYRSAVVPYHSMIKILKQLDTPVKFSKSRHLDIQLKFCKVAVKKL